MNCTNTRFSERLLIPNVQLRRLLTKFASKGLGLHDFNEMSELLNTHAPAVSTVVRSATISPDSISKSDLYKCVSTWSEFLRSLASTSPVCGLIHPSQSTYTLMKSLMEDDVTRDALMMKTLQEEIPVLFNLIRALGYYPQTLLKPLLQEMMEKAKAPFVDVAVQGTQTPLGNECSDKYSLSFFPNLPVVRSRGHYQADRKTSGQICNKKSSRHPSLLPGIFTLFCEHGTYDIRCTYIYIAI